jgi:hypothetical protein
MPPLSLAPDVLEQPISANLAPYFAARGLPIKFAGAGKAAREFLANDAVQPRMNSNERESEERYALDRSRLGVIKGG